MTSADFPGIMFVGLSEKCDSDEREVGFTIQKICSHNVLKVTVSTTRLVLISNRTVTFPSLHFAVNARAIVCENAHLRRKLGLRISCDAQYRNGYLVVISVY